MGKDADGKDETHDIDEHVALAPLDLLPSVKATGSAGLGRLHALAIENGDRGILASPPRELACAHAARRSPCAMRLSSSRG